VKTPAVLLAIALLAAPGLALAAAAADGAARVVAAEGRGTPAVQALSAAADHGSEAFARLHRALAPIVERARGLLTEGYQRVPALVVILSALLILPAVALVSWFVQATRRRKARRSAVRAARRRAQARTRTRATTVAPIARSIPAWPSQAWLTIDDGKTGTLPLQGQTVSIGRHEDNDIRLPDAAVHRYHAVIERTSNAEFVITDLSGTGGNGVRVNGERQARAQLLDGDLIELGRTKMKFESAPV